jgi:hypothetical protein
VSDTLAALLASALLLSTWLLMHHFYKRIHGARLKWWAIPFAHGAVLMGQRLKHLERP